MNEECDDCGGLLGIGGSHICDPDNVELTKAMKQAERDRKAAELDQAAFFLSTETLPENTPAWRQGYEFAIKSLRQEASSLREGARKS